jgi:hypothetical protein
LAGARKPYQSKVAARVFLDAFHKTPVEIWIVLKSLDLFSGEVLFAVEADLLQHLTTTHHHLPLSPWWWDPSWRANDMI